MNSSVVVTKVRIPNAPSMPLDRIDARLETVWQHRVGLVVAPAGSGKTTLLSRFALRHTGPVGWYRAEGWDRDETTLLAHVEAALAPSLSGITLDWQNVANAANALESWPGEQILLVIDDLHTLQGTPAEVALERLIEYAPPQLTILIASRVPPLFNLPRMRVSGELLELTGDDLRFRSWEVERLFHDFYEEPLLPEELARLARRTEGWAAGLQLFHLATRGRTADERRRVLGELGSSSRFTRDYLTRNVLHQLPHDLRRFLLDSSVLGRLSGSLCDRLLARTGSAEILADLESRRLFTQPLPEDGQYRFHEVLRSYLHAALLEEAGAQELHSRFRAAAEVLLEAGAVAEALEAYCHGEDWDNARRLLASQGAVVADGSHAWVDAMPPTVMHDPWLLLASARRLRAEGQIARAIDRYQRAESAFGSADPAGVCREERLALAWWNDPAASPRPDASQRPDASSLLRAAMRREPMTVLAITDKLGTPTDSLVGGLAALAAGNAATARRELLHAAQRPDASSHVQVIAGLAAGVAGLLMGQKHAALEVDGAVAAAESLGLEWISRVGRAAFALTGGSDGQREADAVAAACDGLGDHWGGSVARVCLAWGALVAGREVGDIERLIAGVRELDAPVLEGWARSMSALSSVRAGQPDAQVEANGAEAFARSIGSNVGRMLAYQALAEAATDADTADEYGNLANEVANETGLQIPRPGALHPVAPQRPVDATHVAPISIRVFGTFEMRLLDSPVDLTSLRPRVRTLLRLLAVNAGTHVHHEQIESALWPDAPAGAGSRNLHVAVATLRRALEPASSRGTFQLIRRDGDAYVLDPPAGSDIDIIGFERAIAAGRAARERGDAAAAVESYQLALDLYTGDLLPADGPAEWAATRREQCRLAAVEASQALAELLLARGEAAAAAQASAAGLKIERYHDPLWRLLIESRDKAGDHGAATKARHGYDRMLAELGIATGERSASSSPL